MRNWSVARDGPERWGLTQFNRIMMLQLLNRTPLGHLPHPSPALLPIRNQRSYQRSPPHKLLPSHRTGPTFQRPVVPTMGILPPLSTTVHIVIVFNQRNRFLDFFTKRGKIPQFQPNGKPTLTLVERCIQPTITSSGRIPMHVRLSASSTPICSPRSIPIPRGSNEQMQFDTWYCTTTVESTWIWTWVACSLWILFSDSKWSYPRPNL